LVSSWEDLNAYLGKVDGVSIPPVQRDGLVGILQGGVGRLLQVTLGDDGIEDVEYLGPSPCP
ncbi:MAG: hypothetical protein J5755_02275, partial [Clostridia bacterium]|nr:hypothetical protein [Clostridia bacterium]